MNRLPHSLLALSALAATGLSSLIGVQSSAWAARSNASEFAQSTSHSPHLIARRWGYRFNVRPSGYRRGGFSRGESCLPNSQLTPITPEAPPSPEVPTADEYELAPSYDTASGHPTFFFHLPRISNSPQPFTTYGKLTLEIPDDNLSLLQRVVYDMNFELSSQSGIVGVQLPEDAPVFAVGDKYAWRVSVRCDPTNPSDSLTVIGGVAERVPGTTGSSSEQLEFYVNQGIWQEAVTLMAEDRYVNPSNVAIANDFAGLLESVGLGAIAHEPVVQIIEGQ